MKNLLGVLLVALFLTGCVASRVSTATVKSKTTEPVKVIALDPSGGLMEDAVGVDLSNLGFIVLDTATTSKLFARLNMTEVEIATPVALGKLKEHGVDAYLTVRSATGYDGQVQSASARLNSTSTGRILAGTTWQQGWGGRAGSLADRLMHKGLAEAAEEITDGLMETLAAP